MNQYVVNETDLMHNLRLLRNRTSLEIIGVIKGNGYGFGLEYMAGFLTANGIRTLAVTELDDVRRLRETAFDGPVLLLRSTTLAEEAAQILALNCITTVGSLKSACVLNEAAGARRVRAKAHIKIDTGLSRYGFTCREAETAARELKKMDWIDFEGIYTHFSSAYSKTDITRRQYADFRKAVHMFEEQGYAFSQIHCANTPAFLNEGKNIEEGMNAVRIGSGWTGRVVTWESSGLKPVGFIESDVLEIKEVPKGTAVGYSGEFRTRRPTKLAVIPLGHYDGFGIEGKDDMTDFSKLVGTILSRIRRYLTHQRMSVEIGGDAYPVVGYVGLTSITADVTGSGVKAGDKVRADLSPLFVNPLMKRDYRR